MLILFMEKPYEVQTVVLTIKISYIIQFKKQK